MSLKYRFLAVIVAASLPMLAAGVASAARHRHAGHAARVATATYRVVHHHGPSHRMRAGLHRPPHVTAARAGIAHHTARVRSS